MKTIIVCITLAAGAVGGAYSVTIAEEAKEVVNTVPVEYIEFQEPLYIRGYATSDLGDAY